MEKEWRNDACLLVSADAIHWYLILGKATRFIIWDLVNERKERIDFNSWIRHMLETMGFAGPHLIDPIPFREVNMGVHVLSF